jgi:CRP/FNR family transcriptional regulator, cyclic AMP receptor protein
MSGKSQVRTMLLNESEAKKRMRQIGWLSQTPEKFTTAVLGRCQLKNFGPGEPVFRIEDPPGGIYGLVSGTIAVSIAPNEDGPYFAHLMTPGNWFGLGAAAKRQSRAITLTAARQSQLLLFPMTEIDSIVAKNPDAWRHLVSLALMNSDIAIGAVGDLLIRDPVKRCIATLLRLSGHRHSSQDIALSYNAEVTQEELAHLSNLSRNATGSILRSMAKRGLLELSYRQIRVIDPDALRAIVHEKSEA